MPTNSEEEKSCLLSLNDSTLEFLKRIEPSKFPQLWITINIFCMGLSVYMLCLITTYDESRIGVGVFKWPLYNAIVVLLWIYQCMIPLFLRGHRAMYRYVKILELLLVCWYTYDAFLTLVANNIMIKDKGRLVIDCCVNIVSYFYVTVKTIKFLERQYKKEQISIQKMQDQYAAMIVSGMAGGVLLDEIGDQNDDASEASELDCFEVLCTCQSLTAISCVSPFCDCLDIC